MKTKASITKKWEFKISEMKKKTDLKYNILLSKKKQKVEANWEWEVQKLERKKNSEIKKREEQYIRKMNNEIREMEGKPKRVYKTDGPKIKPLQFAMDIAQENSKLRDTDKDGNGRCISCNKFCSRGELAGGHRYSRRFQFLCLEKENINAQCHSCNWATGPRGNTAVKDRTNAEYDKNLEKKFPGSVEKLKKMLADSFKGKGGKYNLNEKIPQLIEENERLWGEKSFYTPKKKWRHIWEEYSKRH